MQHQNRGSKSRGPKLQETESLTQKSKGNLKTMIMGQVLGAQLCKKQEQKPLQAEAVRQECFRRKTL